MARRRDDAREAAVIEMDWTPYGPHAALVRFADKVDDEAFAQACAIRAELERNPPEGLLESAAVIKFRERVQKSHVFKTQVRFP